jgi:hypothetical protein
MKKVLCLFVALSLFAATSHSADQVSGPATVTASPVYIPDALKAIQHFVFKSYTLKFITFNPYDSRDPNSGAGEAIVKWTETSGKSSVEKTEHCLYWITGTIFIALDFREGFTFAYGKDDDLHQVSQIQNAIVMESE